VKVNKVLYLTTQTSPYMIDYFNLLGQSVNLHVVFEQKNSKLQKTRWNKYEFSHFDGQLLNGISLGRYGGLTLKILKYIKKDFDYIFVTNPLTPSGMLSVVFMKMMRIDYIIESEGGFPGKGKGIKEIIKKLILSNALYYFSGNEIGDKYLILYGAQNDRIIRFPFSSVFEKDILKTNITLEQKKSFRSKFNIEGTKVAVGIGRLELDKNWEWLINEWENVNQEFHLYIIGEGSLERRLKNLSENSKNKNVHILNYMKHKELLIFISYFDILVHPTLSDVWGLTINEGMARGLPVVTTTKCLGGVEMIENNINGYVCDTTDDFLEKVNYILQEDGIAISFSLNNIKKIKSYTIEKTVRAHLDFIEGFSK